MAKAKPMFCEWCGEPVSEHVKKCTGPKEMDFEEIDGDGSYTITELIGILDRAKRKYGGSSELRFDAGHNNVQVRIAPVNDFVDPPNLNSH